MKKKQQIKIRNKAKYTDMSVMIDGLCKDNNILCR